MKAFNIIRSQEWWGYKLPPLLALGYATTLMSDVPLYKVSLHLFFLLSSLVVGAIYVSVINDITDLEEDLASGKSNRIEKVPEKFRWLIPAACILIGLIFGYFLYPDLRSCFLYLCSWIVFSLYSIKPIRLKNRGILGVFADASGSHVFTSLLMVSSMTYVTHQTINWNWFAATGVWSLCYGLRGILWHQFSDRENDMKVNLNTYASRVEPLTFKNKEIGIMVIEAISLLVMLYQLSMILTIIALFFYFILVFVRIRLYKTSLVLILSIKDRPIQILMADYYQIFLPLSLLITAFASDTFNLIVLIVHIFLFPYPIKFVVFDYLKFIRSLIFKKYRTH